MAVRSDVSDSAAVEEMVDKVEAEFESVDILISNAGIALQQSLEEITVEDWDRVMNVDLRSAFLLAKRLASRMREQEWGRMVFVSSVAAFTGVIVGAHYTDLEGRSNRPRAHTGWSSRASRRHGERRGARTYRGRGDTTRR